MLFGLTDPEVGQGGAVLHIEQIGWQQGVIGQPPATQSMIRDRAYGGDSEGYT